MLLSALSVTGGAAVPFEPTIENVQWSASAPVFSSDPGVAAVLYQRSGNEPVTGVVVDVQALQVLTLFETSGVSISCHGFAPSERAYATGSLDGTVSIWDYTVGQRAKHDNLFTRYRGP